MDIRKLSDKRLVFLDGAMGTMLQKKGLPSGECPEKWNAEAQDKIIEIHREYIRAGVDIINTNTFGGNRLKLAEYGLADREKELNQKGVEAALKAREMEKKDVFVAGSIGPTGKFLKPMGEIGFEEMFEIYAAQVKAIADAGADIINFETMVDVGELRIAVLAAREVCDLPIFASLTFTDNGRTLTGSDPVSGFNILQGLGVEFIGMNCGMGPEDMASLVQGINAFINARIVVQANAGIPKLVDGKTVFTCSPFDYVTQLKAIVKEGVNVIGGCCGTTPEFMEEVIRQFKDEAAKKIEKKREKVLISSPSGTVEMGKNQLFTRIGEKINPSALKKVANDIRTGSVSGIKEVAKAQEEAGATMLDVNLGLAGGDEVKSFERVIPELASFTGLPLCIDTTHPVALEEALKLYPGRALINSISGEKERIETVLPVMKKYGSYAVLLPLDEEGIPETVEKREKIIKHILKEADKLGIPASRFIVDALVMTISAAESMVDVSLETVRKATEMGLCTTCGLSNVSFGLPGRNGINAAFLAMLMGAGLDSAILNPQDELLGLTIDAGNVLSGRDEHASKYIEKYQAQKNISFGTSQKSGTEGILAEKLLKFLDTIEK